MRKVGTAFHETMKLRRTNLTQVLKCVSDGVTDRETIYRRTSLGANEAKTAPAYLRCCGLIDWENRITLFGKMAIEKDHFLSSAKTEWLIHYHMCAPHCAGPGFWGDIVRKHFIALGEPLDFELIVQDINTYITEFENKEINYNTVKSSANIFLKAYSELDGLGGLEILREEQPQTYLVGTPVEIPWRVMAYVLADFWEANWGPTLSVPHAQLNGNDGPAVLMLLNSGQMGQLLKPMQEAGLVEVNRVTRPWTVVRKWPSKDALLEAVYADHTA